MGLGRQEVDAHERFGGDDLDRAAAASSVKTTHPSTPAGKLPTWREANVIIEGGPRVRALLFGQAAEVLALAGGTGLISASASATSRSRSTGSAPGHAVRAGARDAEGAGVRGGRRDEPAEPRESTSP
jgi:hypothetical protein